MLRWNEADKKPVVAYPEDCVWCLACEAACPAQCIEVIRIYPLLYFHHTNNFGCKNPSTKEWRFALATIEDLGEVISTDVLVIGGGIGGLVTAVKAKEENPDTDVLIVEKQTTGW